MSSINIDVARPTGIYFIIERLYSRDGLMPSVGEISPSLTQVHRTVIQLKRKQDMFMDGVKVTPKDITLWQQIKYITGYKSNDQGYRCVSVYDRFYRLPCCHHAFR